MLQDLTVDKTINMLFGNVTNGSNNSHVFPNMARNSTKKFAAGIATFTTTVVGYLPVCVIFLIF